MFNIETDSFDNKGKITGKISIAFNGCFFPEKDWNDFPIILLEWWSSEIKSFINGAKEAQFQFMDGPFKVNFVSDAVGKTTVTCYNKSSPVHQYTYDTENLKEICSASFLEATKTVLDLCRKNGWNDDDIEKLASSIKGL
ncbi:hypothetical protein JMN32_25205 [Fulvivirga sp. 29W222]|uniref:Uncharacterized protein n=1 Tax=Fulvivirga marina TaxID=2494733 RepID=A0A937G0M3_9BACT|nr:hypothetical protein [Fulvivirga marina]MBL6449634.1 hypothetical protein [Fulvivirga marina]